MDNLVADYALLCLAAYRDKRIFPVNRVYPSIDWLRWSRNFGQSDKLKPIG